MHYFIGNFGHFCVITSFITALVTAFSYFMAAVTTDLKKKDEWRMNGRVSYYFHALSVVGTCAALYTIILNHYYEYHYAYSYSDSKLELSYLISTFWNGQEGSFLLWMFWHALLGIIIIHTNKFWEAPAMTVFVLVQAFLASMILGVVIPGISLKIGSSPFILLRDAMQDAPIFKTQPEFVPSDGTGLNALLQNYWMVIHPPTLFLGFALTLVPFSFCLAGLWLGKFREWVRPALPWALCAGAILGLGILMGGYWAYETLSFGGYWNWDPVENAVYVPWLILVASIHTMITYKNSETALKASVILVVATFILILYSTFLTRSGVLGDSSAHSFTDLGLSGQLLIYLLFFLIIAIALAVHRWSSIPSSQKEASTYSREFWIFIGTTTLCMMGFQVIGATSIPAINKLLGFFGVESNVAPPADQVEFYTKYQLWFAVAIGLLSGIGQFFWWKKIDRKVFFNQLITPIVIAILVTLVIVNAMEVYTVKYIILLFAGCFTIVANLAILINVIRKNPSLSGGAVAHIGMGMMLIGILFSSGYSKVVSLNNTGMLISNDFSKEFNRDNLLLFVNEPRSMWGYEIEYAGERIEPRYHSGYIKKMDVLETLDQDIVIAKRALVAGSHAYKEGDSILVKGENTFFEITLRKGKDSYTLYPRAQINPEMGGLLASPDIYRTTFADLYTHVSSVMNPSGDHDWSEQEDVTVKIGKEFFANDYVATLESVFQIHEVVGVKLPEEDAAVKARIRIQGERGDYFAEPVFVIKDGKFVRRIFDDVKDLGLRFTLLEIRPDTDEFVIGINTRQKDWVVIKAMEKPWINILWIGTLVLMAGFFIAMVRRFNEFKKMRIKGQE
jgi:cytochrome c-type biogenesis protein CcmF